MHRLLRASKNWPDFRSRVALLNTKQRGDAFELLAKHYLQLNPTYKTKLRHVWLLKELPARIKKRLNLPAQDEGIDLVGETTEGEYWAIQCKYRDDETKSLTRRELSTFTDLAFGICKNVSLALVCTTADRVSHKLKLHGDRLEFCAGDVWRALEMDFFRQLRRLGTGKPVTIKPKRPRKHQGRAIRNGVRHFRTDGNARGRLISPCGSGKSLTAYWLADKLKARTVLVAVPSLALIKQSLGVWATEAVANGRQFNWICVCSDESVATTERDDTTVLVQDLGVRVHTDPAEVAAWLRERRRGASVVFTTYQSGRALAEAAKASRAVFDLGIFDEAHRTTGKKDGLFAHLLHNDNIDVRKRVFMTATERRYAGQSEHILSMDDPQLYGDTFEHLSFKEALECQPPILSDYRIVSIAVTRAEVAEIIRKRAYVRPDKGRWSADVEAEMLAAAIALRKAIERRPIKHAVSFHNSIARARAFKDMQDALAEAFPSYKALDTFHIAGKMPTAIRSRTLEEFANSRRGLITNARCLVEGVNIPNIDCVLFADPRRSTIDVVQAVGRALRTSERKKCGYILIPVLVDDKEDLEAAIQQSTFDSVLQVLRALSANDERIVEYFRSVAAGRKQRRSLSPFELEVPDGILIDTDRFVSSIELEFWNRLARLSWRPFAEARAYVHGLGLKSIQEWKKYCKGEIPDKGVIPSDIPRAPFATYRNQGWKNWGDWLGTGTVAVFLREYRGFDEARAFARTLGLQNQWEWAQYCKGHLPGHERKPDDIPTAAANVYRDEGWISLGDWLGTGIVAKQNQHFRSFTKARQFARSLRLHSGKEWLEYCRGLLPGKPPLPSDVPKSPCDVYLNKGWKGWGHWLGTGTIAVTRRRFRAFKDARRFAQELRLESKKQWAKYCKGELAGHKPKPDDIPASPSQVYTGAGWEGWGDWLGTGTTATFVMQFRSFKNARAFVRRLKLENGSQWKEYCRGKLRGYDPKPQDIPSTPRCAYKDKGWKDMSDWLGVRFLRGPNRQFRSFVSLRQL